MEENNTCGQPLLMLHTIANPKVLALKLVVVVGWEKGSKSSILNNFTYIELYDKAMINENAAKGKKKEK